MQQQRIPIFPLGVVLLPQMPLPLHIFEQRYREMIARCMDEDLPFGVVHASGSSFASTGCTARIDRILEHYDDGRSDILTIGENRFRIEQVHEDTPYYEADVTFFTDSEIDGARRQVAELAAAAIDGLEALGNLNEHEIDREPLESLDYQSLSFMIGASNVFTVQERQTFLDMQSTQERLQAEISRIEHGIEQRSMIRKARETIGLKGDLSSLLN